MHGYVTGAMPPGRSLPTANTAAKIAYTKGATFPTTAATDKFPDPPVAQPSEVYMVARNLLLSHAEVVHLYRTKFQEVQGDKIGMVLVCDWTVPYDLCSKADHAAAARAWDFQFGWFLEPLLKGEYPESMRDNVPPENLHGFIWLFSVPWGIYELLMDLNKYYPLLKELYITENGFSTATDLKKTAKMVCEDDEDRINYHRDHLANLAKAMKNIKYEVKGYFVWAWCDTYEWNSGYTVRFGLNYVDYANDLARYPKNSAAWFAKFLHSKVQPPAYFRPWWTRTPGKPMLLEARAVDENVEISLTKG